MAANTGDKVGYAGPTAQKGFLYRIRGGLEARREAKAVERETQAIKDHIQAGSQTWNASTGTFGSQQWKRPERTYERHPKQRELDLGIER